MKETPNYYAVIPANVRYDPELKDKAKLLYGEIVALSNKNGYCFASNRYFAELYGVSKMTISLLIKNLVDNGYIETEIKYKENSKEIDNRYIKIVIYPYIKKSIYPIYENLKDNNININNTSINIKENIKRKNFQKPTVEEVSEYCKERNNNIDPYTFIDFYESKDWYVGKNKMKDWKACIRTWEKRSNKHIEEKPEWFGKDIKIQKASDEEIKEMEEILKSFK
jgi:hypothetical protein